MRVPMGGRFVRTVLVAGIVAILAAVAASVGVAVSPTGTNSAAHQYQYEKKVTICHRTGSKKHPFVTIRVSRSAVRAHLRHGDKLGPCSRAKFAVCHKARGKKHTVKVKGVRALKRHLHHGDRLGSCQKSHNKGKGHEKKQRGKRKHG
jgi:hypothetical protein